jgi:cytoskeletal protein RodZ
VKSIGQVLRSEREKKKLTLQDVQKHIKIHPAYIRALEDDNYSVFEGKVHAKGFLRLYSKYLELNTEELLALWRRDYERYFEDTKTEKLYDISPVERSKIVLTPRLVLGTVAAVLIFAFFAYLYFQYSSYTDNPKLILHTPEDNLVLKEDIVDITGTTELDSKVFINNQEVVLNSEGNFAGSVRLREGINSISIVATNMLDKRTEEILTVIYRPDKPEVTPVDVNQVKETTESTSSKENSEEGNSDSSTE